MSRPLTYSNAFSAPRRAHRRTFALTPSGLVALLIGATLAGWVLSALLSAHVHERLV